MNQRSKTMKQEMSEPSFPGPRELAGRIPANLELNRSKMNGLEKTAQSALVWCLSRPTEEKIQLITAGICSGRKIKGTVEDTQYSVSSFLP